MPAIMVPVATNRPTGVTGVSSPYPTVVIVTTAHHSDLPKVVIVAPAASRSASNIANDARNTISTAEDPA